MKSFYVLVFLFLFTLANAGVVRRVKPSGTAGTGATWATAYTNLHAAIIASAAGDTVWIAAGTYTAPLNTSYTMKTGVKIYGGFAGTETLTVQRNWKTNLVTIKGNGTSVFANVGVANTALLDGVTITGGTASYGAGMSNTASSSPTISNVVFKGNTSTMDGGAMWNVDGSPTLTNIVFSKNQAGNASSPGSGGAIYNDESFPVITNCVFVDNTSFKDGGAISTYNSGVSQPVFINLVFFNNSSTGAGGAIFATNSSVSIINCSFFWNHCNLAACGGGVHNYSYSGNPLVPNPKISNCLFFNNTSAAANVDIFSTNVTPTISYSFYKSAPASDGNIASGTVSPVIDMYNGAGPDLEWMTADDGMRLDLCKGRPVIDRGNDAVNTLTKDITGLTRKMDNLLVPNGGASSELTLDIGAYEEQTTSTPFQLTGSIVGSHTVPKPQELVPDSVKSGVSPLGGMTISWEKNEGGGWVPATPASDKLNYVLPELTQTTSYQRVVSSAAYCNIGYKSNPVQIIVVTPDGSIKGKVVSKNGTVVKGINIRVTRIGTLPSGADPNFYRDTVTGDDGTYTFPKLYYGDPADGNAIANFRITPSKPNHAFNYPYLDKTLQFSGITVTDVDFKDTTVFSISGRVSQTCASCLPLNTNPTCPLDSVEIWKGGAFYSYTTFIDTAYGRYGVTISDPATINLQARFRSHLFSPTDTNLVVADNVNNVNFSDLTTHTITGKLTAGCGSYIGTGVLEFTDLLPTDANGNDRPSCFRKQVTTAANTGAFSITLPARKYSVRLISFTSAGNTSDPGYVFNTDVIDFVNTKISKDSLVRDITTRDTVLNIVFERKPVLQLIGLPNVCTQPFAIMQQDIIDSFTLKAFQGPVSFGCPVNDTSKIKLFTSIPSPDNTNIEYRFTPADTGVRVKLKGGTPYIIAPFYKVLNVQFKDKYGRDALPLSRDVVVTGMKTDVATFTTVSPEIPMLVLHDPPGDNSYSFWETNQSFQTAFRMFTASGLNTNSWLQAKIGTKFAAGIGISTESEAWGTINGSVNVGSTNTRSDETIITATTSTGYSTSSSPTVTGSNGDVYIGAALNLIYSGATEIKFTNCGVTSGRKLAIADNGFATQYIYTEGYIRDNVIPTLIQFAQNPGNTAAQTANYQNQVSVWQQVLANNAANKARAKFAENYSFNGGPGEIRRSTTTSVSKTSSIEFRMNVDLGLAIELGFEIGGSGLSGGVAVNFKAEMGNSNSTNITNETKIGFVLDDDDVNDAFSVNVKTDPVYCTPVFELAAGTASCPTEEGAQPRDEMQLSVPVPAVSGIPENGEAQFVIKLGNTSPSGETRTYMLSFDQSSNPNGAIVTLGGSPVLTPIPYTIGYLGEVQVTITVKKAASSNVFSYEGLKFILTDACTGERSKVALISAYFTSSCSSIVLAEPENNWINTAADGNLVQVKVTNYNVAGLTGISMEYSPVGTSNWLTGFTRAANLLNVNGTNGTIIPWNILGLPDGAYNIRIKLMCAQGTTYSQRASGIIDRTGPKLVGKPDPTDDTYVIGDLISARYNENISFVGIDSNVVVKRLSNNSILPATVTGYNNQLVVTPVASLAPLAGEYIQVIIKNLSDLNGNMKSVPDTFAFVVGNSIAATGNSALNLSITNPLVYKNGDSTINVYFNLPAPAPNDMRVNYTIAGNARIVQDYNPRYPAPQPSYTEFNGARGTIVIPKNANRALLKIDPKADSLLQPDKSIIISLAEGGDYGIGAVNSVAGSITSEDSVLVYTFIGDGNFSVKANWLNGNMPLTTLPAGKEININPSGVCLLNVPLTIRPGAKLTVKQNKQLVVQGSLKLQ